jgi:LytS/YehU family sensor histidine kinase
LASLTARLQPHFLFNTLNSISSLIRTDPIAAEHLLGRFAALLRASLDAREGELVTLRKELKLVTDYLEIQHARYGNRLRYELDIPAALLEARVPPFSIQTLVENSVKYAVAPSTQGSMIRCLARARGAQLCLEVWDEGPGFSVEQIRPQHGIDNLCERLRSIYGSAARLVIERERSCSPERTRVALELPVRAEVAA